MLCSLTTAPFAPQTSRSCGVSTLAILKRRISVSQVEKINILKATFNGYTFQGSIEYALVNFQLDTNYACDIFQSCE